MPWTGKSFAQKHNHSLKGAQADKAAQVANAILKKNGDEAQAIKIANATIRRMSTAHKSTGHKSIGHKSTGNLKKGKKSG